MSRRTVIMIMVVAWLIVPTGTPDDVITFFIIKTLGPLFYAILLAVILLAMWKYKVTPGKIAKFASRTIKKVTK